MAYIVLVCVCECVSSCTVRHAAPDGVMISQFITLLPHSDCREIYDRPEAAPTCLLFYSIFLSLSSSSLSPSVYLSVSDLLQAISTLPLTPPPCAIFPPNLLLHSLCGLLPCSSSYSFTLCLLVFLPPLLLLLFPPALHPSPSVLLYSPTP